MIGVVVAEFNDFITDKLLSECERGLNELGLKYEVAKVPGAFEVPLAAKKMSEKCDIVIALGCVIEGGTNHYDMVCRACTDGIMQVQLETGIPIVFEVLMVKKMEDAAKRVSKGYDAAKVAHKLLQK